MSHPAWVRELKLERKETGQESFRRSHPAWVRELKRRALAAQKFLEKVAPRVGA